MSAFFFDLRDVLRGLRRDPAYASTVVLTLALTIGATTAMFSIVDGVLLRPLAYREADRLVVLNEIWRQFSDRMPQIPMNERHFDYWRDHARSFDAMAQYLPLPANLTGAGEAAQITVARTSGTLFEVLGVQASLGRTLRRDDEPRERGDVVVVSDRLWRERLGADRAVLGRAIAIDGKPATVVGVLPPDFRLPVGSALSARVDAFVPLRVDVGWVGDHNDLAIGRLRRGVSIADAQAELDVLQAQVSALATSEAHETVTLTSALTPLTESVVGQARRGLLLLFGAIVAVLLIACSNLANLSLTRTLGRLRDAAIRAALGAGRRRLIARAVIEQVALAIVGGVAGLWVAWAALALFVRTAPIDVPRLAEVSLDRRVVTFAAIVSLVTGVLVSMVPAWRMASRDVQARLRIGGAAVGSDRAGARMRASLLALQVALSVSLLAVTGLLTLSFVRLLRVDHGFSTEGVLTVGISVPAERYTTETLRRAAYDRLLSSVRALPGVERVTTTSLLPLTGGGQVNFIVADGVLKPRSEQPSANFRMVAPEFFQTLRIPLRRGRSFTDAERDPNRPLPAVVSEPVAERLWPGQDPIGKRFGRGLEGEQGFEVVGVATDAGLTDIARTPPLMVYVPYWWRARTSTTLMVRTAGDPLALVPAIRRAVQAVDPEIAVGATRSLEGVAAAALSGRRYQTELFIVFGAVALFIAMVGVYAMTAYGVSRRRREMNIRVALGARPTDVLGMVVRQESVPIVAGTLAGTAGALGLGGVVASLLFDVRARDPWVLGTVTLFVGGIAILASLVAARRGLSLDPASALRQE